MATGSLLEVVKLQDYSGSCTIDRTMADRSYREIQWNIVVDAKLNKAAKAAAKEAGLSLSAWVRQVVRGRLGLPTI